MAVIMLAIASVRLPVEIVSVLGGVILGAMLLDSEYFLNAFVLDTKSDFSKTLVGFVKHSDWGNALKHVYYHKEESKENSLNSALFQMVLALMCVFVVYSTRSLFAKAFIISAFAQSIYIALEYYFKDQTDSWFWALNNKPNRQGFHTYIFVMFVILSFCLYIF